jgi:hypothetical protein
MNQQEELFSLMHTAPAPLVLQSLHTCDEMRRMQRSHRKGRIGCDPFPILGIMPPKLHHLQENISNEEGMPWSVYRVALGVIVPVILGERPPGLPANHPACSDMHKFTYIHTYCSAFCYVLYICIDIHLSDAKSTIQYLFVVDDFSSKLSSVNDDTIQNQFIFQYRLLQYIIIKSCRRNNWI